MAITDLDEYISKCNGGSSGAPERIFFHKDRYSEGAADNAIRLSRLSSLWLWDGFPARGAAPGGTWVNYDNTSIGGLLQTNPGGSLSKWLLNFGLMASNATAASGTSAGGVFMLYDRLGAVSGFDATVTPTPQTIDSSITRYTDGKGVWAFIEVYAAIGGTTVNAELAFTDFENNSVVSADVKFGGASYSEHSSLIPITLLPGSSGVKTADTISLDASTTAAGDYGVTLGVPLAFVSASNPIITVAAINDFIWSMPPEVLTDACLALAIIPPATASQDIYGSLGFIDA